MHIIKIYYDRFLGLALFISTCFYLILFNLYSPIRVATGVILISLFYSFATLKNLSSLLGVLIILLYTGGILVIFLYMTSLSFNPVFKKNLRGVFVVGFLIGAKTIGREGRRVANDIGVGIFDF